jgi:hypothetical protein
LKDEIDKKYQFKKFIKIKKKDSNKKNGYQVSKKEK